MNIPMRTVLLLALFGFASLAGANPPPGSTPVPEGAPTLKESGTGVVPTPEVTIVQHENARFEEYRIHGKLYKIKVTPKVGPPYYLMDDEGANVWRRYDSLDSNLQPPRWVLMEF